MHVNHDTALRHARDVAADATRTPSQRNLARAYIELRARVAKSGSTAIDRIDAMLAMMDVGTVFTAPIQKPTTWSKDRDDSWTPVLLSAQNDAFENGVWWVPPAKEKP
jgi:hypothetical protein